MTFLGVILLTSVATTVPFSGKKLKALRLAAGLTQAELAHRAHVRERQVIRWENEQHVPRLGSVKALARVLKTSVESLMASDEDGDEDGDGEADLVADLMTAPRGAG